MAESKKNTPAPEPLVRRHRPLFVGLFVFIPLITIPALLIFTLFKSNLLQNWYSIHVLYENSQSLKNGNAVTMSGTTIGYVKEVNLIRERKVHVRFDIRSDYKRLVKKDTRALLTQRGFLGDWEIELTGGSKDAPEVNEGDTLQAANITTIDDAINMAVGMMDDAQTLLKEIMEIVHGINAGIGTVGKIFKEDSLYRHINQLGSGAVALTSDIRKTVGDTRGTIRATDTLLYSLTNLSKSVETNANTLIDSTIQIISQVNKSFGAIDTILQNFKTVSSDAPDLLDRLQDELAEVELMMQGLQQNWLLRRTMGSSAPKSPQLQEAP